jgi:AcrR family transcriptional regulator
LNTKRLSYHHGDLRAALIKASDDIISEVGIEGFSLRAAAKRAGVSPGAPAHHFGSAKGLLTEVAFLAFGRVSQYLEETGHSGDPVTDLRALSLAFVTFALDHPGHFRLMFRNDLVNREDPRYPEIAIEPGMRLSLAIAAYHGKAKVDLDQFEDAADIFCGLSMLHGLAHMVLEEKVGPFFSNTTSRDFLVRDLPSVLARMFPNDRGKSRGRNPSLVKTKRQML